jgi:hypothetical protein
MTLQEQLNARRAQSRERMPAELRALMHQGTETLRQSGLADRSLKVGETMPAFTLPNATGQSVSSTALLAKGPLVVSFYRGGW